ncbi:hypothetical protein ECE07_06585 [Acinetobacter pittii]|nr:MULTISPECIES: hypothetical protein [Acinetobacter]MCK0787993.1 hypothetical protein [Acinetobacter pittii]MCK0794647.1 hypothetical protein [Acinetobacter pittii]MCU4644353.1 hypothetical protein [Acinetobacter pittii]MCY3227920.1 hypothetical protein [Acinetobacter pittii]MDQ9948452.1 hypothetical protein [Acinetobacter sp. 12966]
MSNLLTAAEAFAALQNGKTVLCRPIGDMLDFSDLDQFPASVFGKPGFEFCIKIETIELAGITFTKPLTIDEYEDGQEVYVISTYSPTVYVLDFKTNALIDSINSGFVQRDAENAKLQLKALSKALGFEVNDDLSVIRLGDEKKKQRGKKSKAEPVAKVIPSEVFPADKQPAIVITEQTNVTASEDLLTPVTNELNIKPNVNAQFEILLDAIRICQSEKELDSTCANLEKEGFTQEQIDQINLAKQERLIELDFIEMDAADTASEQVFSDLDAQANDEVATISMPENYESLVQSIQNFHTPEEVNSVIRYTTKWTEEQRKPLLNEMHKRLAELKQTKQEDDGLSPLIVRLQYAADLKTLEELELEIPSRHQDVHKTLWNMAKKRRSQLNAATHEPAYLLEDGL